MQQQMWSCSICTYDNEPSNTICSICQSPRNA